MSEIKGSYGPKKTEMERLADFLTGYLGPEILEDIPCPEHLQCDYDDLDDDGKQAWYEYTANEVLKEAVLQVGGFVGRPLTAVELNLIKRRVVLFFEKSGITYK